VPLEIALLIDVSSSVDPMFEMEKMAAGKILEDVRRPSDRAVYLRSVPSISAAGARHGRETAEKVAIRGSAEKATAL